MYTIGANLELISVFMLIILSGLAANRFYRLLYWSSEEQLHRKSRRLYGWAVCVTAAAAAALTGIVIVALYFDPVFWLDRVFLHGPLLLAPAVLIWAVSVPKLKRLRQAAGRQSAEEPDARLRHRAGDPALAFPFRLGFFGSVAVFYFNFVPPSPGHFEDAAVPLILVVVAAGLQWLTLSNRRLRASVAGARPAYRPWRNRLRNLTVLAAAAALGSAPFISAMDDSRLPESLRMDSGPVDYGDGSGTVTGGHGHAGALTASATGTAAAAVPVTALKEKDAGEPDVSFTLTAQKKTVALQSGKTVEAWTYNGQIPGPELRVKQGQLVRVALLNKDIEEGVTLHWHGLDIPNAEDGVAGATQDAVMPGGQHVYLFRAEQAGTFWYHTHQQSQESVSKGLFGAIIVDPATDPEPPEKDLTVLTHRWDGAGLAIGDRDGVSREAIAPGTLVKLRLIHTDDWVIQSYTLEGAPFRVTAIDGTDLHEPGELKNVRLSLPTGGRYDIEFRMPEHPVYLRIGNAEGVCLLMSPDGKGDVPAAAAGKWTDFDPTAYGTPAPTPFGEDSKFDRRFEVVLDNELGFYNGAFEMNYTINGEVFPKTPMFMVREGDLVKTTFVNRGAVEHPMHLHGHHMLVLSHNGKAVTGSPWWSDTLSLEPGDSYEVAFRADNPGLWMDHCHNLTHAKAGMTMHLMYEGVTTPFEIGGKAGNHPE